MTFVKAAVSIEVNDVQLKNMLLALVTLVKAAVPVIEANDVQLKNILSTFVTLVKAEVSIEANDEQLSNMLLAFVTFVKAEVSIEANDVQPRNMALAFVMLEGSLHIPDNLVRPANRLVAQLVHFAVLKSLQLKSIK